jgi:hypothetical protein
MKPTVLEQYFKVSSSFAILIRLRALSFQLDKSWLDGDAKRQRYQMVQLLVETPSGRLVVMKPQCFAK